jgi:hypothetical protein
MLNFERSMSHLLQAANSKSQAHPDFLQSQPPTPFPSVYRMMHYDNTSKVVINMVKKQKVITVS